MRRWIYIVLGIILLIIGLLILANSFKGITGLAIIEDVSNRSSALVGIYFIFAGLFSLFLSKKRKVKGQAAIEFLVTYGWAILAAIIVLGALAFFGIFNPDLLSGGTAIINPPFYLKAWRVTSEEIILDIQNAGPEPYQIKKITVRYDGGTCSTNYAEYINPGKTQALPVYCDLSSKKNINGDIEIAYNKWQSSVSQTVVGTIKDKVFFVPPIFYYLTILKLGNGQVFCGGGSCDVPFSPKYTFFLTAEPDFGYDFAGWSGEECQGLIGDCEINVNRNLTITATFIDNGGVQ